VAGAWGQNGHAPRQKRHLPCLWRLGGAGAWRFLPFWKKEGRTPPPWLSSPRRAAARKACWSHAPAPPSGLSSRPRPCLAGGVAGGGSLCCCAPVPPRSAVVFALALPPRRVCVRGGAKRCQTANRRGRFSLWPAKPAREEGWLVPLAAKRWQGHPPRLPAKATAPGSSRQPAKPATPGKRPKGDGVYSSSCSVRPARTTATSDPGGKSPETPAGVLLLSPSLFASLADATPCPSWPFSCVRRNARTAKKPRAVSGRSNEERALSALSGVFLHRRKLTPVPSRNRTRPKSRVLVAASALFSSGSMGPSSYFRTSSRTLVLGRSSPPGKPSGSQTRHPSPREATTSATQETATAEEATRQEGTATGRLPLGQGHVGAWTLEVATSPAEMGLDARTLVEVKLAERHYSTSCGNQASTLLHCPETNDGAWSGLARETKGMP